MLKHEQNEHMEQFIEMSGRFDRCRRNCLVSQTETVAVL